MEAMVFTTLGVGVSPAAVVLTGQRSLRTEIAAVETRLGKRIARPEDRVSDLAEGLFGLRRPRPPPEFPT